MSSVFVAAIISAFCLLFLFIMVLRRAFHYLSEHPEIVAQTPPPAYDRCHVTLSEIVTRYQQIKHGLLSQTTKRWQAFNGRTYTVNRTGMQEQRETSPTRGYHLSWGQIGGVGVCMQPGFTVLAGARDAKSSARVTSGYTFHLLIVPISGSTIDIPIPLQEEDGAHYQAVEFAAYTLALAEQQSKRVNVFGFDRPPAPYRQRMSRR